MRAAPWLHAALTGKSELTCVLRDADWIWAGEHVESYTPAFPTMMHDSELSQYKLKMRKEYEAAGYVLNNGKSQAAHLAQARMVYERCTPRCIIIFDDTFPLGNGLYSGKGGAAMRFLLSHERFEVVSQSALETPSYNGFVVVRRLDAPFIPDDDDTAAAAGTDWAWGAEPKGEAQETAPVLEWISPEAGADVAGDKATVELRVLGAVNGR